MKYKFLVLLCIFATQLETLAQNEASASSLPKWLIVEIGIIGAASEDILEDALGVAEKESYSGVLIQLDTPGGALESTRGMVKQMMGANFPVAVWVGPNGARAASAGSFITMAAHVAAMAPGTNIGAAAPIQASGQDIEKGKVAEKVENDTVAFIESIARTRNRNLEVARSFVLMSVSITADEAKENNVIDMIAKSSQELLANMDGMVVTLSDGVETTIQSKNAILSTYQPSLRQEFLRIISNPNLFYLFFLAGLIGLGFELTHPGAIFPGVVGGICLILALISMSVLPVSFGALLLVLAGIAFLVAEMFVPSFGILGIGGFVAFVMGSVLLVDPQNEQGLRISFWTIAPGAALIAVSALGIGYLVLRAERSKVSSGQDGMIGVEGAAVEPFANGEGQIRILGEIWNAQTRSPQHQVAKGDIVKVTEVRGLRLIVQPLAPQGVDQV